MKIRFIPGIDTQLQQILKKDLAAYESSFDLTDEERRSLYEWASEGTIIPGIWPVKTVLPWTL